jgi:DNA polymerase elongation subunit (family B)
MDFWTNCSVVGNSIGLRGIENGRRVTKKVPYDPVFYLVSKEPTEFRTFDGKQYLVPRMPGTIWESKKWLDQYKEVEGMEVYGNPRFEYAFITDNFPKDVPFDTKLIYVVNIDIEVDSSKGQAALDVMGATETVLSITIETNGVYHVWAMQPYTPHIPNVNYYHCTSELELLASFINFWTKDYPDVVTGWNIQMYDIPYLLHRITKVMGEDRAKTLSPWGRISQSTITQFQKEHIVYNLQGLDILDYMDLFKKFSRNAAQESYKLNDIAFELVGEEKLDYGNRSLSQLYNEDFQKFIEYNIHDTTLVRKIDQKEKLLDLAFTLAYQSHTNPSNVFKQVRMWTQIIDDFLAREGKFSSAYRYNDVEKEKLEGAYVKDALSGIFDWVVSFDATSLYPSLIMQHNISPDTFIDPSHYTPEMMEVMAQKINVDTLYNRAVDTSKLKEAQVTLTANAQLFRIDEKGFLPRIIDEMFANRQANKKKMLAAEKLIESLKKDPNADQNLLKQAENDQSRYDALQNALKVCLNSSYGALGNHYFFHFDIRLAEAITVTGQLSNRWATRAVNGFLNGVLKTDEDYVIAGDTDSVYVHMGPLVEKVYEGKPADVITGIDFMDKVCKGPLGTVLKDSFDNFGEYLNVHRQMIYFKREALADRAIWTGGKKRYIVNVWDSEGVRYSKPKIKIKGFEMVKSSHPKLTRTKMKEAVSVILNKSEAELWKFISDFRKDFFQRPVEDIAFPRSCNNLTKYRAVGSKPYALGCPQNVKAALIYNHALEKKGLKKTCPSIVEGEKIKYVMLKEPNPIHEEVLAFPYTLPPELGLHPYVDYDGMFEKTFVEPLKIILNAIGWTVKKQVSLKSLIKKA